MISLNSWQNKKSYSDFSVQHFLIVFVNSGVTSAGAELFCEWGEAMACTRQGNTGCADAWWHNKMSTCLLGSWQRLWTKVLFKRNLCPSCHNNSPSRLVQFFLAATKIGGKLCRTCVWPLLICTTTKLTLDYWSTNMFASISIRSKFGVLKERNHQWMKLFLQVSITVGSRNPLD